MDDARILEADTEDVIVSPICDDPQLRAVTSSDILDNDNGDDGTVIYSHHNGDENTDELRDTSAHNFLGIALNMDKEAVLEDMSEHGLISEIMRDVSQEIPDCTRSENECHVTDGCQARTNSVSSQTSVFKEEHTGSMRFENVEL